MKLGILTSGDIGKDTLEKIILDYEIYFVLTDSNSLSIIELCTNHKIPFFKGNPRDGSAYKFVKNYEIDVIISINYLFLIKSDIINHPKFLSFNMHGSLLPKYRGRTPHVWSIINNEKSTGITAHLMDTGCDTGDIITKIKIPINENDTGFDLLNKYRSKYYNLVKDVIGKIESGKLNLIKQDEKLSTYYGKRSPEDGKINWNWQKQRIKNWVRALSYPYPGAFSYFDNKKIIIDEVIDSNIGFKYDVPNGTIIANEPNIIVKTPNGTLELKKLRKSIIFNIGDKLI